MSATQRDYALSIVADIGAYQRELAKIPGFTEKQAAAAALKLEKQLSRAAEGARKKAEAAAKKATKAWEDTAKGFKKLAGSAGFGGIAGDIEDLVEGLGAVGPVAGIAAGALAGVGAAGYALYKVVDAIVAASFSIEDFEKRTRGLQALGNPIPAAVLQDAKETRLGYEALGLAVERISNTYGVYYLPVVKEVTLTAVELALRLGDVVQTAASFASTALPIVANWSVAGQVISKIVDQLPGYSDRTKALVKGLEDQERAEKVRAEAVDHAREAQERANYEQRKAEEWARKREGAEEKLAQITEQARAQYLTEEEKISARYDDRIAQIEEQEKILGKTHESEMARRAAELEALDGLADLDKKRADDAKKNVEELAKIWRDFAKDVAKIESDEMARRDNEAIDNIQKFLDRLDMEKNARHDLQDAVLNGIQETASIEQEVGEAVISSLEKKREEARKRGDRAEANALTKRIKAMKTAAQVGFRIEQAAALSQIAIDTQRAIVAAFADPTLIGPARATAIITALTAAASAASAVASQSPPKFHSGGPINRASDERDIRARDGEYMLNPQGRRALGDDNLRRANAGMPQDGGEIVVIHQYQHRVFGAFVQDNLRANTPLRQAVRAGRRAGRAQVTAGHKKHNGSL